MMPMEKELSVSNVCPTSKNSRAATPNGNVGIANFETTDAVSETSDDKSEKSDGTGDDKSEGSTIPIASPTSCSESVTSASSSSPNDTQRESILDHPLTETQRESISVRPLDLPTYKLVGDNVDKSITPRQETSESHKQSLHYFHTYAVKDRCSSSHLSDSPPAVDVKNADVSIVLPTDTDCDTILHNMSILFARVVQKRFNFFKDNVQPVVKHIPHCYSEKMKGKSEVVGYFLPH